VSRPLNAYAKALDALDQKIEKMGRLVIKGLDLAAEALIKQDGNLAVQVQLGDDGVDEIDDGLQYRCLELLTIKQPTENELRRLAAVQRVSRELERFGDYTVNIAEAAAYLAGTGPYFKPLEDIPLMSRIVKDNTIQALLAYRELNLDLAAEVTAGDDRVDGLFKALHDELIGYMKQGARYVEQGSYLLLVARYLERAGDHGVNVAETVKFILTGERRPKRG